MTTAAERKQEAYDLLRLINDHDLSKRYAEHTGKQVPPFILYRAQDNGRAYQPAAWQVIRPGFKTDDSPKPYWRDNNHKTFIVPYPKNDREPQRLAAIAWASQRYGIKEWKKTNRLLTAGGLHPAEVIDWLEARIRELKS